MKGGEGVKALDVAAFPDSGNPVAIADAVLFVDFVHRVFSGSFLGLPHASGGFDAGDSGVEVGAGDPEPRRHLAVLLVFYDARQAERAPGGDAERFWDAS